MPTKELEALLIAYIDSELDAENIKRVEDELRENAALRGLLSMMLRQRTMLAKISSTQQNELIHAHNENFPKTHKHTQTDGSKATRRTSAVHRHSSKTRKKNNNIILFPLAAAACAAAIIIAIFLPNQDINEPTENIAQKNDPVIEEPIQTDDNGTLPYIHEMNFVHQSLALGAIVPADSNFIIPENASLILKYADESTLSFTGPSQLYVEKSKTVNVILGSANAEIAEQKEGENLHIRSPHGVVTVIGTSFDILVTKDSMETFVREGVVEVRQHKKDGAFILQADEHISIGTEETMRFVLGTVTDVKVEGREKYVVLETNHGERRFVPPWQRKGHDSQIVERMRRIDVGQSIRLYYHYDGERNRFIKSDLLGD